MRFFNLLTPVSAFDVLCGIGVSSSNSFRGIAVRLLEESTGTTIDSVLHPEGWLRLPNGHGFLGVGEGAFTNKYIFVLGSGGEGFSRTVAVFDKTPNQPYDWLKIKLAEALAKVSEPTPA